MIRLASDSFDERVEIVVSFEAVVVVSEECEAASDTSWPVVESEETEIVSFDGGV